jgi:hypothetical protein
LEIVSLVLTALVLAAAAALLIARIPQRWLWRALLLWLAAPFLALSTILVFGALTGRAYEGFFAFMLFSTIIVVPWLAISAVGITLGFALRRKRPDSEVASPVSFSVASVVEPPVDQTIPPVPQSFLSPGSPAARTSQTSPDGSIRVDIEPVEWNSGLFVNTPRVIETATGRVLCDLLGTDWEAHVSFPGERTVWLGLRRCRAPGYLFADFNLDAQRYRIALDSLDTPDEEGAVGDITARLDHWWAKAASRAAKLSTKEGPAPGPGPFAAWRAALVILVCTLAAIAGLTWLSLKTGIEPPKLPMSTMPHIPRLPH